MREVVLNLYFYYSDPLKCFLVGFFMYSQQPQKFCSISHSVVALSKGN